MLETQECGEAMVNKKKYITFQGQPSRKSISLSFKIVELQNWPLDIHPPSSFPPPSHQLGKEKKKKGVRENALFVERKELGGEVSFISKLGHHVTRLTSSGRGSFGNCSMFHLAEREKGKKGGGGV